MPCSFIGAPTMVPMLCRGFSDEYGSWKIIWMSRRSGRSRRVGRCVMSSPSKRTVPPVGSSRRVSSRPVVDLPQPDSPTTPSVSPRWTREARAVDGLHRTDLVLEQDRPGSPGSTSAAPNGEQRRRRCAGSAVPVSPGAPAGTASAFEVTVGSSTGDVTVSARSRYGTAPAASRVQVAGHPMPGSWSRAARAGLVLWRAGSASSYGQRGWNGQPAARG